VIIVNYVPPRLNAFVSHSTANLEKKYAPRMDVPVVAHGIDESGSSFALIERSPKTSKKT
jgi:hypothetical protein